MYATNMMTLHTFELSLLITMEEYHSCRNILYALAKENSTQCFVDSNGWLNYRGFCPIGVSLSMRQCTHRSGAVVRLKINPASLCGSKDPTELFLPKKTAMNTVIAALQSILQYINIRRDILEFQLHRLDLCKDVQLDKYEHLLEYLRLFKKGSNRSYWTEECFGDERDLHSVRRGRNDYKVTRTTLLTSP